MISPGSSPDSSPQDPHGANAAVSGRALRRAVERARAAIRNRRRPWMLLAGVSVGWKVVLLTLGAAVPRWVIGDGLDGVPHTSRAYAAQAKVTALSLWDHPLERLGLVQALRVVAVDHGGGDAPAAVLAREGCAGRTATVRAYTYFAIPYSQARMVCDSGVVEYRLFRRHP